MGSLARRLRRTTLPQVATGHDRRLVVYGATCTWWGTLDEVKATPAGLPCCPYCGGVLFETSREDWTKGAARQAAVDGDEYLKVVAWLREAGRCFKSFAIATAAWREEQGNAS